MKDIVGFEGLYAVTKDGRIWAYPRIRKLTSALGKVFNTHHKGRWLSPRIDHDGYSWIHIKKNKQATAKKVHRYVALAYIPNPLNLPEINHKNCNKLDNRVQNLEWCTRKENAAHAIANGRYVEREIQRKLKRKALR